MDPLHLMVNWWIIIYFAIIIILAIEMDNAWTEGHYCLLLAQYGSYWEGFFFWCKRKVIPKKQIPKLKILKGLNRIEYKEWISDCVNIKQYLPNLCK